SPFAFGIKALNAGPLGRFGHNTSASASWGTRIGETKLVASISSSPEFARASMNRIFAAVGIGCFSFSSPSRGPTSTIRIRSGILLNQSFDHGKNRAVVDLLSFVYEDL